MNKPTKSITKSVNNDEDILEILITPNILGLDNIVLRSLNLKEYEKQRNNPKYEPKVKFAIHLDADGAKIIGESLMSCAEVFKNRVLDNDEHGKSQI